MADPIVYEGPAYQFYEICVMHNRWEPFHRGVSYWSCYECMHVYQTEDELLHEHNKLAEQGIVQAVQQGSDVWTCPLCTHDF